MNRLPNMMVLDFCEYLKRKSRNGTPVLDLLSDESNSTNLRQYAEEYMRGNSYSFKSIIHKYIDSKYFDRSLHRYPHEWVEGNKRIHRGDLQSLRQMAKEWRCCGCCERGFF